MTERGAHVEEGNMAAAGEANKEHQAAATTLLSNRKARQKALPKATPRRPRMRVKTEKLAVGLQSNMESLGLGFEQLVISKEELESGENAEEWASASAVVDKGPDCICLSNFCKARHPDLNLDWKFDPNHGSHHSSLHGMDRANLRVHSFSQVFSYNVGLGEWKDGVRREQIRTSVADTLASSSGPAGDIIFRFCLGFLESQFPPPEGEGLPRCSIQDRLLNKTYFEGIATSFGKKC